VLESATEITDFGVVFNKLSNGVMSKLNNDEREKDRMVKQLSLGNRHSGGRCTPHPLFVKLMPELQGQEGAAVRLSELENFLKNLPPLMVHQQNVNNIQYQN
jgi:hypothetical protein